MDPLSEQYHHQPQPPPPLTTKQKAEALHALATTALSSSLAKLSNSSRGVPSGRDFHFYANFDGFRSPAREIASRSESALKGFGVSGSLWGQKPLIYPNDDSIDEDGAYDWLVNVNDELLERFGVAADEYQRVRKEEEVIGRPMEADGFQVVFGRKKKGLVGKYQKSDGLEGSNDNGSLTTGVKVASKDKKTTEGRWKVPFHIPTIRRPQDEFNILVNNSNMPFEHVWLQKSEDGQRFIHPLENFSEFDFVDKNIENLEPVKPPPLESTPFKLVEGVKELKELAAKLRSVNEFAVDLEHNQYRSFQGLTCLMQISTRTEDFIVDTLKLRVHVGPYLREVFKDPSKRKVMHGADRDIHWLQRDFGIYVCNMFDTGQASRVLQLERNSLEYLLRHYCDVTANKELHEVDCNAQQLAIVAGLCEWRDIVARTEDESTGYILPNKLLLEIARQVPLTTGKLKRLVKSKNSYVERNLGSVISVIRSSMENAAAFESISEQIKKWRTEAAAAANVEEVGGKPTPMSVEMEAAQEANVSGPTKESTEKGPVGVASLSTTERDNTQFQSNSMVHGCDQLDDSVSVDQQCEVGSSTILSSEMEGTTQKAGEENNCHPAGISKENVTSCSQMTNGSAYAPQPLKTATVATVQIKKKPSCAFGALFGNTSSKRKPNPVPVDGAAEKDKTEIKLEQIKSSVTLPFFSFSSGTEPRQDPENKKSNEPSQSEPTEGSIEVPTEGTNPEDIILLDNKSDDDSESSSPEVNNNSSLSELSSSLQKCFQSINDMKASKQSHKQQQHQHGSRDVKFEPFDYATARQQIKFGHPEGAGAADDGDDGFRNKKDKNKGGGRGGRGEERTPSQNPRRRQAFPASGNRSGTFR
ncbi:hypothetical protein QJS04_geneDACA012988 [Acorus gramineus]|uniref:HRDC domain-containing protein n=1 Tax=Acorus gramineus TaxID=55184 RepID=A0AAV9B4M7_ACOGR|nr:hypothetical protein QJS04_geneDACA012988 [Acorus gramineus]